jgi:hypothetical protein
VAWIGVVGLALTLTGSLEPLIKLGNVVHFVIENWRALTGTLWDGLASLLDVKLSPMSVAFLNGGLFALAIEIASFPRETRSWRWFPVRIVNAGIVVAISWWIAIATVWPDVANVAPLPEPFDWKNWTHKETLVPLLCWSFLTIQTLSIFDADPLLMGRRLFDVAVCVLLILGLNYVATHAELIRNLLGGTLAPVR